MTKPIKSLKRFSSLRSEDISESFKYTFSLFDFGDNRMAELKVEIPERFIEMIGDELKSSDTKALLRSAVEDKLKVLLLFRVVDDILKKSKLTDEKAAELAEELKENVAKRHGLM